MQLANNLIMIGQLFLKCAAELKSSQSRCIDFLKLTAQLAQIQSAKTESLLLYSLYSLCWQQRLTMALLCVEQALEAKPALIVTAMLLGIRGAVLTKMEKYSEALQALKDSLNMAFTSASQMQPAHFVSFFPLCMTRVLQSCNFNHGRREFIHLLDKVRIQSSKFSALSALRAASQKKAAEIRSVMRVKGKTHEDYRAEQSWPDKTKEATSNIYINRLYTERRQTLGQRQNSSRKHWNVDPYQLTSDRPRQQSECLFM